MNGQPATPRRTVKQPEFVAITQRQELTFLHFAKRLASEFAGGGSVLLPPDSAKTKRQKDVIWETWASPTRPSARPRRAIALYEQHLTIAREIGNRREEGHSLGNLGNAYAALGETQRAIELHEQALIIDREIGDRRGESQSLGNMGVAYAALGENRRAIELHEQALIIDREIGDRRGEGNDFGNLGIAYKNLGENRRAIELYEQRLAIAREIGDRRGEGNALGNLGIAYADLGETRRALDLFEQVLAIFREIGDRLRESNASWHLGLAYEKECDLARCSRPGCRRCRTVDLETAKSATQTPRRMPRTSRVSEPASQNRNLDRETMPTTPTVFISYSHKDEAWKDHLLDHLGGLEGEGFLKTWNDRDLGAGDEWFEKIQGAMNEARVAVLLVSAHSLKSKFIRHKEIPHLLERRTKDGMTFIPVIVKACAWDELPWLARFQVRPVDGKPLAGFRGNGRDAELTKIAKEILKIVRNGALVTQTPAPKVVQQPPAPAPLHQLPTPPPDFTGRQEDLDFLRPHLAQGGTGAIFGLRGMGGVGKTTLALKLAAELKPEFPDAQIYLDLKGVDPQPLTGAQAMAHVIRAFHPEARLPEGDAEVAGLYRTVLDGKRVLLLMDNAAGKEQVQPLIPPSTCLLLVTSRFHFALPGMVDRDLEEMSETEARDLLAKIAPRVGDAADEIARLCGGLPLALRLAGSALSERRSLSPVEYVRRLKEGKERFDGVDASLNLSYELLDEERQRLWCLLAVFPGSFDGKAAAAVWELDPEAAQDGLDELVRISLVDLEERRCATGCTTWPVRSLRNAWKRSRAQEGS